MSVFDLKSINKIFSSKREHLVKISFKRSTILTDKQFKVILIIGL